MYQPYQPFSPKKKKKKMQQIHFVLQLYLSSEKWIKEENELF